MWTSSSGDENNKKKRACVIGGSGYVGSLLCKLLLQKGYSVRATVRNKDNPEKTRHLEDLQRELGDLKIFEADLTRDGSFDQAIDGSYFVFHVATPVDFKSLDPQKDMIEPAVEGTMNVLKSCLKTKTVRRVVLTSSMAAVCYGKSEVEEEMILDENVWSDIDHLLAQKPPTWGYAVSKTMAEKAGMRFAEEKGIDLVTILPSLITGPSLTPGIPNSVALANAIITGDEDGVRILEWWESLFGLLSVTHIEDVANAHIFLAEDEDARGRFICNGFDVSFPQLSLLLRHKYPHYTLSNRLGKNDKKVKMTLSSKKLIDQGFVFKYNMEETYDESVKYLEAKGVLHQ